MISTLDILSPTRSSLYPSPVIFSATIFFPPPPPQYHHHFRRFIDGGAMPELRCGRACYLAMFQTTRRHFGFNTQLGCGRCHFAHARGHSNTLPLLRGGRSCGSGVRRRFRRCGGIRTDERTCHTHARTRTRTHQAFAARTHVHVYMLDD